MIVRSGAIIHPFSDLVNGRFPPQEAINLNKYTFYKKKFHKVPPPAPPLVFFTANTNDHSFTNTVL